VERKTAAKQAPRPKAAINAKATLMNVKSVAGANKPAAYHNNYTVSQETAIELTLRVSMGAPTMLLSWSDYKQRAGGSAYQRSDHIDRELAKLRPAKAKAKKGEKAAAEDSPATVAASFDEAAERKRLEREYDARQDQEIRAKYERECSKANASNARFMERAAAFAMFLALRGTEVQLSLSPVQQGFRDMFAGSGEMAALTSGEDNAGEGDED
jgi:hypothetical protein